MANVLDQSRPFAVLSCCMEWSVDAKILVWEAVLVGFRGLFFAILVRGRSFTLFFVVPLGQLLLEPQLTPALSLCCIV